MIQGSISTQRFSCGTRFLGLRFSLPRVILGLTILFGAQLQVMDLEAGTVFMKNGYIIQGPIVDENITTVVLGWENGKVHIHRRFLESVILSNEEQIAIEAKRKVDGDVNSDDLNIQPMLDDEFMNPNEDEQLPDNFDTLISKYNLRPAMPQDGEFNVVSDDPNDFGTESGGFPETSDGEITDVEVIIAPRRMEFEGLGITIEAPEGWGFEDGEENVRWVASAQTDGFLPSVIIIKAPVENWNKEEALNSLREDPKEIFPDFQIVEEGEISIHGRPAFQIVGTGHQIDEEKESSEDKPLEEKGLQEGDDAGKDDNDQAAAEPSIFVRQILIPDESQFWLITTFSTENTEKDQLLVMDKTINSIQFLGHLESSATEEAVDTEQNEETDEQDESNPVDETDEAALPIEKDLQEILEEPFEESESLEESLKQDVPDVPADKAQSSVEEESQLESAKQEVPNSIEESEEIKNIDNEVGKEVEEETELAPSDSR